MLNLFIGVALTACVSYPNNALQVASWYGPGFHNKITASGEVFDQNKLTGASRKHKFGTKLKLINVDNGKSVVITVNDYGPRLKSRDLDISYGAAKRLGMVQKGVQKVIVKVINV